MRPDILFALFWSTFAVSWLVAARWSSPTIKRHTTGLVWLSLILLVLGILLIMEQPWAWLKIPRLWSVGRTGAYVLALLTLPGFLFAWWARIHLGRLWSGTITRKEGHRLIVSGPYAIVRHPIYTGLLEASLVSAIANGRGSALLGFVMMALGLWLKAQSEERFLIQELGLEVYEAYRRQVPMLLPFAGMSKLVRQ